MPRDSRLYMTFPIDFHRHPKIQRLSDAAFRAFVEANGESRLAESDGTLESADAEFMWSAEVLAELVASHPTRPVMLHTGTAYILRDYAEHQFTKADREELTEKRAKAGRASADARKARVEHMLNTSEHPATESESGLGDSSKTSMSQSLPIAGSDATDSEVSPVVKMFASQRGVDIPRVVSLALSAAQREVDPTGALQVATWLLEKSKNWPDNPQRYIDTCFSNTPFEIQAYIDSEVA